MGSGLWLAIDPRGAASAQIIVGDLTGRRRRLSPAGARELARELQCDPDWEEQDAPFVDALVQVASVAEGPVRWPPELARSTSSLAVLISRP